MELAIGNFVTLSASDIVKYRFQNFFINQSVAFENNAYGFLPFGFSGVTINRTGDNTEASLVFPNNALSRAWTTDAVKDRWLAHVRVIILNPDDSTSFNVLHEYYGQIASATWGDTTVQLPTNTILDAVGTDIPRRKLTQKLVGSLPTTANVYLQ
jgi:hypothetical protein